jgi:hypothetical protein
VRNLCSVFSSWIYRYGSTQHQLPRSEDIEQSTWDCDVGKGHRSLQWLRDVTKYIKTPVLSWQAVHILENRIAIGHGPYPGCEETLRKNIPATWRPRRA